jgi:hypothetical protein
MVGNSAKQDSNKNLSDIVEKQTELESIELFGNRGKFTEVRKKLVDIIQSGVSGETGNSALEVGNNKKLDDVIESFSENKDTIGNQATFTQAVPKLSQKTKDSQENISNVGNRGLVSTNDKVDFTVNKSSRLDETDRVGNSAFATGKLNPLSYVVSANSDVDAIRADVGNSADFSNKSTSLKSKIGDTTNQSIGNKASLTGNTPKLSNLVSDDETLAFGNKAQEGSSLKLSTIVGQKTKNIETADIGNSAQESSAKKLSDVVNDDKNLSIGNSGVFSGKIKDLRELTKGKEEFSSGNSAPGSKMSMKSDVKIDLNSNLDEKTNQGNSATFIDIRRSLDDIVNSDLKLVPNPDGTMEIRVGNGNYVVNRPSLGNNADSTDKKRSLKDLTENQPTTLGNSAIYTVVQKKLDEVTTNNLKDAQQVVDTQQIGNSAKISKVPTYLSDLTNYDVKDMSNSNIFSGNRAQIIDKNPKLSDLVSNSQLLSPSIKLKTTSKIVSENSQVDSTKATSGNSASDSKNSNLVSKVKDNTQVINAETGNSGYTPQTLLNLKLKENKITRIQNVITPLVKGGNVPLTQPYLGNSGKISKNLSLRDYTNYSDSKIIGDIDWSQLFPSKKMR